MGEWETGRLIYLLLLLAAVGGWMAVEFRARMGQALRTLLAWGLIFLGVAAGYGVWQDIRSTVMPVQRVEDGGRVVLNRRGDGHYHLTLVIGGTPVDFLVDTGATNVVLSRQDARKLGIEPDRLAYLGRAQTANGSVRTAHVTLEDVRLGEIRDPRLSAYVTDGEMEGSLLGMDYLGRFRIEIEAGRMVLSR